jgi:hypothetical protein
MPTETNAFFTWFQTWGQIGYLVINMIYLVVMASAVVYGVRQAKRFVDFKVGASRGGEAAGADAVSAGGSGQSARAQKESMTSVAVEEFVD